VADNQPKQSKDNEPSRSPNFGLKEIIALSASIIISIAVFVFRDIFSSLEGYGYPGIFFISLLGSATLILPTPALVFVFIAGGTLSSPFLVGVLAGIGAALGEFTGYLAGYSSNKVVEKSKTYRRLHHLVDRYGLWFVGILAFVPNPIFDLAGIAAGAIKIVWYKFLLVTMLGKTVRMILLAYGGSLSLEWIERLLS
jgi:membrane protein YqaA with SNARE-associated domain